MPVNEEMRHEVYEEFKRAHGARFAGVIMEMLPPAGVPELATKADLDVLRSEMRAELAGMRAEHAELRELLQQTVREQTNRFVGWLLGVAAVAVAAAGAVAGAV